MMARKHFVVGIAVLIGFWVFAAGFSAQAVELRAGTAKADITPADPKGRILVMGGPAHGVMHHIYARALTLFDGQQRMVIVTYDLNCLDVATPILRARALHELNLDPAFLVLLATHNHAAPIQIAPANYDYGRWLADRLFALIKEAIANEQGPVKLWFGSGQTNLIESDPRYPNIYGPALAPIDSEVQVLKVTRDSRTLAVLFNMPTHPMQASFWRIEVGHPGYAVEELEKREPGTQFMYSDACGADQFMREGYMMLAIQPQVKAIGRKVANEVEKIAGGKLTEVTGPLASRLEHISLPLAAPMSLEAAQKLVKDKKIPTGIGLVPYPNPDRETNWVRSLLQHYEQKIPFPTLTTDLICTDDAYLVRQLPAPREFPCVYEETIVAKIGPLVLVALQGEVCAPIGLRLKNAFRGQFPLFLTAYMGEHNLYIPTRKLVEHNAYQSQVIQTQYASPVPWAPTVEDEMVGAVMKMIKGMAGP